MVVRALLLVVVCAMMGLAGCLVPEGGTEVRIRTLHVQEGDPGAALPQGAPAKGQAFYVSVVATGEVPDGWEASRSCRQVMDAGPDCSFVSACDPCTGPLRQGERSWLQFDGDGEARLFVPTGGTYDLLLVGSDYARGQRDDAADPDACRPMWGQQERAVVNGNATWQMDPPAVRFTPHGPLILIDIYWSGRCGSSA